METKEQLKSILTDLENKELTKHQAYELILILFNVSVSVPSDEEIEALADKVYLEVRKHFPIYEEYEFTQGYIQGAMAMRSRLCTER